MQCSAVGVGLIWKQKTVRDILDSVNEQRLTCAGGGGQGVHGDGAKTCPRVALRYVNFKNDDKRAPPLFPLVMESQVG